jgi:Zn-dependent M28 family amino/carboxypeptidase
MTASPGSTKAARIIAAEMGRIGLEPAGDSGYYQRIPMVIRPQVFNGREFQTPTVVASFEALGTLPAKDRRPASNLIGLISGSDPALGQEHVLIGAHYDHVGIRGSATTTDSIFNGADDDASGVAAVLEIARIISQGPKPRRTVIFATWTGEEIGLLGARWYLDHPVRPLKTMAANLEIEMIGRPDSLAGGPGRAWLTGYERSTLGDWLKVARIPIGPDKRPGQDFFRRSDNYAFALRGIVAHTVSSYNMHADYHRPSDEVSTIDSRHMAAVINSVAQIVRELADGPKLRWKPAGQPKPKP